MMKQFLFISLFLFNLLCFASGLQLSEFGLSIPKDIFLKIAETIVPNLLKPTHPKEIMHQDVKLKTYRVVCTMWRDLLDQRVDFEDMMKLFVITNGWRYSRCFTNLCLRWDRLESSYCKENEWLIAQVTKRANIKDRGIDQDAMELDTKSNNQEQVLKVYPISSNYYFKTMKQRLTAYDYNGLLMLEYYLGNHGFVRIYSLTRALCNFYIKYQDKNKDHLSCDFLEKLALWYDLTDLFDRLFDQLIFYSQSYSIKALQKSKIDYRYFLHRMHWTFYQRVKTYEVDISRDRKSIKAFFEYYKDVFSLKDASNKYFLYHLLLYSKDSFFKIQTILLIGFLKGIDKQLTDYSESEQIQYKKLFEKNFLARFENSVLSEKWFSEDKEFLKEYFQQQ